MGDHYAEIMKELNAKNDEVAFLNAQRSDRDAVIQNAEVHIHSAEAALHIESQQRDVAISMAREAAIGQSAVLPTLNNKQNATKWNRRPRSAV